MGMGGISIWQLLIIVLILGGLRGNPPIFSGAQK